jgi:hypothetical protein
MIARTLRKTVVFHKPFLLKGVDRVLPAGDYRVVTDEELIEGLSFPVYRRVSTMIFVPAQSHQASSVEMVTIDPRDLQAAQDRDRATQQAPTTKVLRRPARQTDMMPVLIDESPAELRHLRALQ